MPMETTEFCPCDFGNTFGECCGPVIAGTAEAASMAQRGAPFLSAMENLTLSVVIPTKNEAENIAACIRAFDGVRDRVEIIVVDNASTDGTPTIAASLGVRVVSQGPERCAQRNRGVRETHGAAILFVDADMILPQTTLEEIFARLTSAVRPLALYIPEKRVGKGFRLAARNFERSFYDGTCIDGLRVVPRSLFEQLGGYDEALTACEDWDLDRRLMSIGVETAVLTGHLIHNEANQGLRRLLAKKAYYSASVAVYRRKWGDDAVCGRQFGLAYRYFGVFVEDGKWKRLVAHPVLAAVMYAERILVGLTYLLHR